MARCHARTSDTNPTKTQWCHLLCHLSDGAQKKDLELYRSKSFCSNEVGLTGIEPALLSELEPKADGTRCSGSGLALETRSFLEKTHIDVAMALYPRCSRIDNPATKMPPDILAPKLPRSACYRSELHHHGLSA